MTDATGSQLDIPDRGDGLVYVMPDDLDLAVRVALAAGRPLLLRGKPGSGKSSLAPYVARQRNWRYYSFVVTSQTRARDLQWTFDGVRRLADAQISQASSDPGHYVEPGPLWWAFAPTSASQHVQANAWKRANDNSARVYEHPLQKANEGRSERHSVVLIDEIDKADPDVPNGLLEPLSSHGFTVAESGSRVEIEETSSAERSEPFQRNLVVITTNEERELPQAFLRRCVVAELTPPDSTQELVRIAEEHLRIRLGEVTEEDRALAVELAVELREARASARAEGIREPSTAEYLDAFWACRALKIGVDDRRWKAVRGLTLIKPQRLRD
ncbi:AAA family ATPase [Streptomyces mirabilis]|uniref:AAA family ATPase n=1 Tax=Streptomyces mirabilis TaxID=68239 RepID=UPI00332A281A